MDRAACKFTRPRAITPKSSSKNNQRSHLSRCLPGARLARHPGHRRHRDSGTRLSPRHAGRSDQTQNTKDVTRRQNPRQNPWTCLMTNCLHNCDIMKAGERFPAMVAAALRQIVRAILVMNVGDPTDSSLETCNMTHACRRGGTA